MYKIIKEGLAKEQALETVRGTIQTPVFMNVGTITAIKGAVGTEDLARINTQVQLSNTYHLHVRPGDQIVRQLGGLHKFMNWDRPILTDSGGFQVFSLSGLRKIKRRGVLFFLSYRWKKNIYGTGRKYADSVNLASTIAMAFDECPSSKAEKEYVIDSVNRTTKMVRTLPD